MDKFAWLKDTTRSDPKVLSFLKGENERTANFFKPLQGLIDTLIKEFKSRMEGTYETYPFRIGDYLYFYRYEEGKDFPIIMRKPTIRSHPETVLDWNELAKRHSSFYPGGWRVSRDGRFLAYAQDTTGGENFVLYVKDLKSGTIVDSLPSVSWWEFLWTDRNDLIYVVETEGTKRPYRVLIHTLGESISRDEELFRDDDSSYFVGIYASLDGYIFASSGNTETSMATLIYPYRRSFFPRKRGVKYSVEHGKGKFYILTNEDAPNYKVLRMDERDSSVEVLIPEEKETPISYITVFKDFLALEERYEGLMAIRIYDLETGDTHRIKFRQEAYEVALSQNHVYETDFIRIAYSSPIQPTTIYHYDIKKRKLIKKWSEPVPNYDPKLYKVKRIWATSYDGVKIPLTVVFRKDRFKKDRKNPVYLVGYGAYGSPYEPTFNRYVVSLLDRGFVYVISHVRGGGEFGERWHREGKFLKKKNSIYDFVESAEYLIIDGWTDKGRIGIHGGSAGGIIVGGALNLKPYLFGAAVASVPFVDVLNTMLDPNLPLTIQEYDEWGNPNDSTYYRYMKSYSPYDNVKLAKYPPILAITGLHDPRVGFWEPAKWILKLRENNMGKSPILLKTAMDEGHLGKAGRYQYMEEVAVRYAFLIKFLKGRGKVR